MKADFDQIKKTTDIVRVVESYGIVLKKVGRDHIGLCPFHEDRTPSLRVTQAKGLFRCPVCNATGNAIQFVARMGNLTDREAALKLLGSTPGVQRGCDLPPPPPKPSPPEPLKVGPADAAALLKKVAAFYGKTLFKERAGMDYLKARGLDDPALLEPFGVGYRLMVEPERIAEDGRLIVSLKDVETLRQEANLAGLNPNLASQNPNFASASQVPGCEVLNGENPHEHKASWHREPNLAGAGGAPICRLNGNGANGVRVIIEEARP